MILLGAHPLSELSKTLATLRSKGYNRELLGQLFKKLARNQGPKWVIDKWNHSGLQWSDLLDPALENIEYFVKRHNLEFMINGCSNSEKSSSSSNLSLDEIHEHLLKLMSDSNFDNITSWISVSYSII